MTGKISDRMQYISPFYVMELLKRAKELEAQGREIVHMEIGEPDFPTPQAIVKAGIDFVSQGQVKYTPASGLNALREKIAEYYQSRYSVRLDENRVFVTPGASGAFLLAMGITMNPGDELIMADPCYPCNSNFIALFGGNTVTAPVDAATKFQLNEALIRQYWTPGTSGVLIASPSNPTGTVIGEKVFEQSIKATVDLGGHFFSDEIYHGLEYGCRSETAIKYHDNAFVINSFSKFFGMTGWRVGWLIVPEYCIDAAEKLAQNIFISTPAHSQFAALAAFDKENMDELARRRMEFEKRRDFLYQQLIDIGFEIAVKPEGAFYIYADCSRFTDDSFKFAKDLLEVKGVAITPGRDFGANRAGSFVRLAYTTSIDKLEEGVSRIADFVNHH